MREGLREGLQLPIDALKRAERFLRACDRLVEANDAFRGKGRVSYEVPEGFSVTFDVSVEVHRFAAVEEWTVGRKGWSARPWVPAGTSNGKITLTWVENASGAIPCGCGRVWTREEFLARPTPPRGGEQEDGNGGTLHLRNCVCGSTKAIH